MGGRLKVNHLYRRDSSSFLLYLFFRFHNFPAFFYSSAAVCPSAASPQVQWLPGWGGDKRQEKQLIPTVKVDASHDAGEKKGSHFLYLFAFP
jgi:hypothetical protein